MTKYCTKCEEEHPLSEFAKDRTKPDGLQAYCREYNKWYQAQSRIINRDRNLAYLTEWRQRNPDAYKNWAKETNRNASKRTPEGRAETQRANRRRRALKLSLPSEKYARTDIELRDGPVSWATGEMVDTSDTMGVQIDHLIPLAYYIPGHPGDVLSNVAFCEQDRNIGRNNRLTSEAMQRYIRNVILDVPNVGHLGNVLEEAI